MKNQDGHCRRRSDSINYSDKEIKILLEVVADKEVMGTNDWTDVRYHYMEWATQTMRRFEIAKLLKSYFDKLSSNNKPSGDPSCPLIVQKVYRIARSFIARSSSVVTLEDSDYSDVEGQVSALVFKGCSETIVVAAIKRKSNASGIKNNNKSDELE